MDKVLFLVDIMYAKNLQEVKNIQNKLIEDEIVEIDEINAEEMRLIKLDHITKLYDMIKISDKVYYITDIDIEKDFDKRVISGLVKYAKGIGKDMRTYILKEKENKEVEEMEEEKEMEDMKTITICGSTKQKSQILELKIMLEAKGYRVFTPEFDVKSPNECVMFSIHKVKMDASDIVYFLLKPRDGLSHEAGTGMQREIQYAIRQEKEIRFVSPEEIRI